MRILIVEDSAVLRDSLAQGLREAGYAVDAVADGKRGLIHAQTTDYDVIVLDWMLPELDGVTMLARYRAWASDKRIAGGGAAVLMLTAKDTLDDKVRGLTTGADDYLVKPFGAAELLARVRAQLRRQALAPSSAQSVLRFGRTTVDLARRVVERDGERLHLTPIEYRLLTHLAAQPDRVVTHQQLLKAVWGPGHAEDTHYVRVHMANLRKKVEDDASRPRHLLTEAGIGYRFRP